MNSNNFRIINFLILFRTSELNKKKMKKEFQQHKEITKRLEKFTKNGEKIKLKTLLKEEKTGYLPSINVNKYFVTFSCSN